MTAGSLFSAAAMAAVLAGGGLAAGWLVQTPAHAQSAAGSESSSVSGAPSPEYSKPDCSQRDIWQGKLLRLFPSGQVTIDCALTPGGALTSCRVVKSRPPDAAAGELVADLFLCYAHVDPKPYPGGIPPGARKKFTYVWDTDGNRRDEF